MLYVANWKMEMSFKEGLGFCRDNYCGFIALSEIEDKRVVLCPSFTEISEVCGIFKNSAIKVGAQDCSDNKVGSYTGQVMAESLREIGCAYCIVGHSERRIHCFESNYLVGQKVLQLLQSGVIPIVCVGETMAEYNAGFVKDVVKEQLIDVFKVIEGFSAYSLCIAYEPVWSVGTGIVPESGYIEQIFDFILELSKKYDKKGQIELLYGGSVDESNAGSIKSISNIRGFLIGGASLDFKKFEKIVQL